MTGQPVWLPEQPKNKRVRPRPINPDERLPIVFLATKRDGHGEPLEADLVEFLKAQEAEHAVLIAEQKKAAAKAAAHVIHVPQVRPVADYEQTQQQALRDNPTYSTLDPTQATYLRYNDLTAKQTMTEVLTDYDMDEMDEACLAKIKAKAASKTNKSSSQGGAPPPPQLSEDLFESIIEKLEQLHLEALRERSDTWQADIKNGRVPKIPATETVLSRSAAVRALMGEADTWVLEALYDHWKGRRKTSGGPLLAHHWLEMPWKAIIFEDPDEPGTLGDMPFMVSETRNSRLRLLDRATDEDAFEILAGVRGELEGLRTLVDQIKKRERLKKNLLKAWKDQLTVGKLPSEDHAHKSYPLPNNFLIKQTVPSDVRGRVSIGTALLEAVADGDVPRRRGRAGRFSMPDVLPSPEPETFFTRSGRPTGSALAAYLVPPGQRSRIASLSPHQFRQPSASRRPTWRELEDAQEDNKNRRVSALGTRAPLLQGSKVFSLSATIRPSTGAHTDDTGPLNYDDSDFYWDDLEGDEGADDDSDRKHRPKKTVKKPSAASGAGAGAAAAPAAAGGTKRKAGAAAAGAQPGTKKVRIDERPQELGASNQASGGGGGGRKPQGAKKGEAGKAAATGKATSPTKGGKGGSKAAAAAAAAEAASDAEESAPQAGTKASSKAASKSANPSSPPQGSKQSKGGSHGAKSAPAAQGAKAGSKAPAGAAAKGAAAQSKAAASAKGSGKAAAGPSQGKPVNGMRGGQHSEVKEEEDAGGKSFWQKLAHNLGFRETEAAQQFDEVVELAGKKRQRGWSTPDKHGPSTSTGTHQPTDTGAGPSKRSTAADHPSPHAHHSSAGPSRASAAADTKQQGEPGRPRSSGGDGAKKTARSDGDAGPSGAGPVNKAASPFSKAPKGRSQAVKTSSAAAEADGLTRTGSGSPAAREAARAAVRRALGRTSSQTLRRSIRKT